MKRFVVNFLKYFLIYLSLYCFAHNNEKWIVVTTINYPTRAVLAFVDLEDWNVVIVADKKTPVDWELPNCHYLSIEKQQNLPYKIVKYLPWNHYARKNLGYLYAIEHGAKIIYDTDDDNILINNRIDFMPESFEMLQCQASNGVFNPYAYFGHSDLWPRGYPLNKIQQIAQHSYSVKKVNPLIQQILVNGDPDVDAFYRLTRGTPYISFDNISPVCVSKNTYCPFNSQSTIYHYKAFWGLVLPITPAFRVCDIWRGYWVQKLLSDIEGCLSFSAPIVVQDRNIHNYFKDLLDEIDLYTKSGEMIHFLNKWKSNATSFRQRIIDLTNDLITQGYYKEPERAFIMVWLEDLEMLGYQFPQMTSSLNAD